MEGIRIPNPPGGEFLQPYPVHLPQFDGPLDLLLHLVRKNDVDLRNIQIAEICRQYHEYLMLMTELDLEVAAEFLYFEAVLVHIKSQMVLPRPVREDGTPIEDPRQALVDRLLQYRKFKVVAEQFHEMETTRLPLWGRPTQKPETPEEGEETDLSEVSLFDLLTFFKGAMDRHRALHPPAMEIAHQQYSIKAKMEEMLERVRESRNGPAPLSTIFKTLSGRAEAIATFLALLELLRMGLVKALQSEEFAEIYLEATGTEITLENYEEAYR